MIKKNLKLLFSIFAVLIIIYNNLFSFGVVYIYAVDSPEEIARQQQEEAQDIAHDQAKAAEDAQREAEKQAQEVAEKAAEETREAEETAQEALKNITPTPLQDLTPTDAPINANNNTNNNSTVNTTSSINTDSSANVNNNNSIDVVNNSNTTANTGDNVISGDPPPTVTITPTVTPIANPIPTCEDYLSAENNNGGEENQLYYENGEITPQDDNTNNTSQESVDNDNLTVSNTNCASVNNDQNLSAVSGSNSSSNNDGLGELATGGDEVDSNLTNEVNANSATNNASDSSQLTVENSNIALVKNDVNADAVSGENDVNNNEGAKISTGDIDMMVTLMNILNLNITGEDFTHLIVNIFGDLNGDVDLDKIAKSLGMSEDDIQAISRSSDSESYNTQNTVVNNNEAVVQNNVDVSGVSGGNDLSGNEDSSKALTGRIKILVALLNFINTNYSGSDWYFAMVNVFGDVKGDIILPDANSFLVDSSGDTDSSNINNSEISSNTNQADVNNNISLTGDSGSNTAYANEDPVTQNTGGVSAETNLSNFLNMNIIGSNWVLLVINVFGTWYGKIIGLPGTTTEAPQSGTLMVAAGGNNNGPQITSGNNENNDSNVSNDNKANIENNVSVSGVSGQNSTNENQDPVKVSTGWVDLSADLMNIVNMNVSGKHWMLVFVNIFGSLIGDINFGPKPKVIDNFINQNTEINNQDENPQDQIEIVENSDVNSNSLNKHSDASNFQASTTVKYITEVQSEGEPGVIPTANILSKEIFRAPNQSNETINNTQVFGFSLNVTKEAEEILFIFSLIIYLIAVRFWALSKKSLLARSIDKQ